MQKICQVNFHNMISKDKITDLFCLLTLEEKGCFGEAGRGHDEFRLEDFVKPDQQLSQKPNQSLVP